MLVPLGVHSLNVDTEGIFCMNIALRVVNAERHYTASVLSVIATRVAASRCEHENILSKTRGRGGGTLSGSVRYLTTPNNCTSDNLLRVQNQRLHVQL